MTEFLFWLVIINYLYECISESINSGMTKALFFFKNSKKRCKYSWIWKKWFGGIKKFHSNVFSSGKKSGNNKKKVGNWIKPNKQDRKTWRGSLKSVRKGYKGKIIKHYNIKTIKLIWPFKRIFENLI